jgi:50S ribosomal protein L16 3-hydroxylase
MDIDQALTLLGGLTPAQFMKRHWHKKPLLVRNAIPDFKPCVGRTELLELAARDDVESRLIVHGDKGWKMRHGPLARRSLPPFSQKKWTFLVQGVDLHHDGVHQLMQQFRFVPDARLDDLMISYASDGGGVGPHFDSYDVFLLQAHGQRRWRIGRQKDLTLEEGVPLKILQNFEPEEEFVLGPGDMLYLPPKYAHDGIAEGECMTWSIGFRSPHQGELAREILQGLADEALEQVGEAVYRDPGQPAVTHPAALPAPLLDFARQALLKAQSDPHLLALLLGEYLTEPKANVWFDAEDAAQWAPGQGAVLDRRTRMLHDERHVFINGEGFRVAGRDGQLLRRLADERSLSAPECARLSAAAQDAMAEWSRSGWVLSLHKFTRF